MGGAPAGGFWVAADAVQSPMLRSTPHHRCFQVIAISLPNSIYLLNLSDATDPSSEVVVSA